jgi:hypothetical protein
MLDGRIDAQGTVKDLQARGVLDDLTHDSAVHVQEVEVTKLKVPIAEEQADDASNSVEVDKKPRKLVKDEHRETGGVKWSIYKAYLKASYVIVIYACAQDTID